jgi:hypothetical protein
MIRLAIRFLPAVCLLLICTTAFAAPKRGGGTWTDSKDKTLPIDFTIQGEYVGTGVGAQVISLSGGAFQAVVYPGGLPGAGWDGKNKILMDGRLDGEKVVFKPAAGKKRYLSNSPAQFSATRKFPPVGQEPYTGTIADGKFACKTDDGKTLELKKTERKSTTMGAKPPKGAIVLFDGSSAEAFRGGRLDTKTGNLNTDGRDILTKQKFNNYTMHLEFMLPYRPKARGQGRGNSGFYQVDHYEVQVLDSFGLQGLNNECGGVYQKADPIVNMCLPPLSWQTYDIDFTNAVVKDGKKIKNAVMTVRHNGVVIHDKLNINGKTGGSRRGPEGTPGSHKLQGHGNPLQYRNIWILEK